MSSSELKWTEKVISRWTNPKGVPKSKAFCWAIIKFHRGEHSISTILWPTQYMWLSHGRSINFGGKILNKNENNWTGEKLGQDAPPVFSVQIQGNLTAQSKVPLIAAGPLGCPDRRMTGRTSDSPTEYQPYRCWWSVPLHSRTASYHQNALIVHYHFSRF